MNRLGGQRPLEHSVRSLGALLFVLCLTAGLGSQQNHGNPVPTVPDPLGQMQDATSKHHDDDPWHGTIAARQEKARSEERQKRLVSDTEKLLALATQLHDDVAKTDKNILSMDVVRRADEIEKLAHSVKERMKNE